MGARHGYHRIQDAAPRDDEAAHSPVVLPESDDLKVILVGYDRQTSPGAVELPDAVYMLDDPFGSVVRSVFTFEVVNPDSISKLVLKKGLDAGTAYEILSIDIADIDVGKNIGATLQIDQANADKNIAQAKAEERRAMAVATEQEMIAKAQEARAEVIQAEAEVPKALAQALRDGNMGFMDYYRLENLKGDTAMRENISKLTKNDLGSLIK